MAEPVKSALDQKSSPDPLLAPCSLYCAWCAVRVAHTSGDEGLKQKVAQAFGCQPEQVVCEGCMSDQRFFFCETCAIRSCVGERGYEGCHQCGDFPCQLVEKFPVPVGKAHILREVPRWRELGTQAWLAQETQRHTCAQCGQALIRGGKRCISCGAPVDQEGA